MIEHGSEPNECPDPTDRAGPERHIHIIKGSGLASLAIELANVMWKHCQDRVSGAIEEVVPELADAGLDPKIRDGLIQYGFEAGVFEMLSDLVQGNLLMKEMPSPEEKQTDGQV
jgi:hypothetical protein